MKRRKGAVNLAMRHDLLAHGGADPLDGAQSEVDQPILGIRDEVHFGDVDVGLFHGDPPRPCVHEITRRLFQIRFDAREQGREILNRIIGLQIGGLIADVSVAERVTLVERVISEVLDDVEQLFTERASVTRVLATLLELGAFLLHEFANLLTASLAQVVRLGERVPGEALRHAHHALLIDHEAVRVTQNFPSVRVKILDRLSSVLSIGEVIVHVDAHRTRSIQGDDGRDVLECRRVHGPQQLLHGW